MKALKIISAVILIIILIAAESLTMGIFSAGQAVKEDSVKEALDKSNIAARMVEEVLAENTVNMGGEYGEMAVAVFSTDAVESFYSSYINAAIETQMYGAEYEEIGEDELMKAFSDGIDEVNEKGIYSISPLEGELLRQALQQEAPELTDTLNSQMKEYETLEGEPGQRTLTEELESLVNEEFMGLSGRLVMVMVCAAICAGIILLCRKSKLGFLWCSVVTGFVSLVYLGLSALLYSMTAAASVDAMIYIMAANGFREASIAGLAIGAVFLVLFIAFKINDRRKEHGQTSHAAERTA